MRREAKARNDPSFSLTAHVSSSRRDRFGNGHNNVRTPVSVHKTDIYATRPHAGSPRKVTEDPDKQCPIHHKPHPLKKCRGFREMPLEERKQFLREHSICFRCCASSKHMAKNCEMTTKCAECESNRHVTALHPGPAPWLVKSSPSPSQDGGEDENPSNSDVTSKCTEVCGGGFSSKSCSKICLVKVYPAGCRNQIRNMYAILDDQSNRSLARPDFFDMFNIKDTVAPYTLKTCAGVMETEGRRATGFIVESADGWMSLLLPTLTECNMIPNNRSEVLKEFFKDSTNSWVAPLPFRQPRRRLPNNREYAMSQLRSLHRTLAKKPEMKAHFFDFMQKIFDKHHAELAPPLKESQERWYLPFFGIYHPQKPGQIRVVFDSSAKFDGVSLNDVLLAGPDLNNSLVGVLLRFRKDAVAVTADIQQMFHCFLVREDCRDVLRFLWHCDNDFSQEIVEYRMRVHVFGNSPSPAVAIYGLRQAAREQEQEYGSDVRLFVEKDFYVDDALKSFSTEADAIDVLKRAQEMLAVSNLRLHKIASNRATVRDAFPIEDRASTIKDFDPSADDLPDQRSLGIRWNIVTDTFTFQAPDTNKPYTRRGLLSVVNSLFDPLGFLAPVIIRGRLLSSVCSEWDVPLPENKHEEWKGWLESLQELKELHIPRTYSSFSPSSAQCTEMCIFSDASVKAIAAVAYLKVTDQDGHTEVGFLLGKTKLAPQPELTVPRLELCAAVLAVEIAELIVKEIDLKPSAIRFYTDSKVVLGYICNQSRRFYVYVNNRIQRIRQSTLPKQWTVGVPTEQNPADCGSRSVSAAQLQGTTWLTGPSFLRHPKEVPMTDPVVFKLVDPEHDVEVRDEVKVLSTHVKGQLGSGRFNRFSTWKSLVRAIAHLSHIAHCFVQPSNTKGCSGWHICTKGLLEDALTKAENIIVKNVQSDAYSEEFQCIELKKKVFPHTAHS